jgi:hypothetical protein
MPISISALSFYVLYGNDGRKGIVTAFYYGDKLLLLGKNPAPFLNFCLKTQC